jgi:hypothetical protein
MEHQHHSSPDLNTKKADPLNPESAYSPTDAAEQDPSGYLPFLLLIVLNTKRRCEVKYYYFDTAPPDCRSA